MKIPLKQGLKPGIIYIAKTYIPCRYENSIKTRIETIGCATTMAIKHHVVMKIPLKQGLKQLTRD